MLRSFRRWALSLALVAVWSLPPAAQPGPAVSPSPAPRGVARLRPAATLESGELREVSGMVGSRRYPGVFWVHNDSGDPARIFAVDLSGKVVAPPGAGKGYQGVRIEGASNVDWEDVAMDGETLYLADLGNNLNARRNLGVYAVREPDPRAVDSVRASAWFPVVYPEQTEDSPKTLEFDCEAVFVSEHKLYLLTKNRLKLLGKAPATSSRLYRLDTHFTDRPNRLTLVERREDLGGWVGAADMAPDGKTLAVLCHLPVASVWLFRKPAQGDRWLSGKARRLVLVGVGQCEALAWIDAESLLVSNEKGQLFRIKVQDFVPASGTGK